MLALREEMTCAKPLVFQQGNTREGRERSERGMDKMRETKDGERKREKTQWEEEKEIERRRIHTESQKEERYAQEKKSERRQEASAGEGCSAHA